jgi:hypothetical protein
VTELFPLSVPLFCRYITHYLPLLPRNHGNPLSTFPTTVYSIFCLEPLKPYIHRLVVKHAYSILTTKMSFTRAIRHVFSSHKSQPQQPVGIYTQSPSEQYYRHSQSRPSRPQPVSLPAYQHEVGVYTQSAGEAYVRRDSHRHAEPVELPRYQRAAPNTFVHSDFYAPINDYVPEYYRQESNLDEGGQDGKPPQYQK